MLFSIVWCLTRMVRKLTHNMKKYIISLIIALTAITSVSTAETISATAGFEGQYVFRGQKISDNVLNGEVSVALPSGTELTAAGFWNVNDKDAKTTEVDLSLAQSFDIDAATTFTVGGTGYFYPKANTRLAETNYTLEAFATLAYNAFLNPSISAGYDFNLKQIFADGSVTQKVGLPFLADNWYLLPSVSAGYVAAKDLLPEKSGAAVKDSYYYASGKIDLVYELPNVVLGVGYRYNYLNNSTVSKNTWAGGYATVRF